jgi:hypothetical protein
VGVGAGLPAPGWGSAGPEGHWAWGEGWVSWRAVGPAPGWGPVQTGGWDPGGRGSRGMAKGWVFQYSVAGAAKGQVSHLVWVWNRAVAWHSLRGRKSGRMEQRLCRPMGQGFGRPAVLLLDRGVVKTSTF